MNKRIEETDVVTPEGPELFLKLKKISELIDGINGLNQKFYGSIVNLSGERVKEDTEDRKPSPYGQDSIMAIMDDVIYRLEDEGRMLEANVRSLNSIVG